MMTFSPRARRSDGFRYRPEARPAPGFSGVRSRSLRHAACAERQSACGRLVRRLDFSPACRPHRSGIAHASSDKSRPGVRAEPRSRPCPTERGGARRTDLDRGEHTPHAPGSDDAVDGHGSLPQQPSTHRSLRKTLESRLDELLLFTVY